MTDEPNEFEDMSEESFTPETTNSEVPSDNEDMVASGGAGVEYDINNAPDTVKAPPRIPMDGQETVIKDVKIILPPKEKPWIPSKSGTTKYKYCIFKLFYDNGQQEFISGLRVFPKEENKIEKYSDPSITRDGINQASALLKLYSEFKEKDINEVSLNEFLSYMKSQPKVLIKGVEVVNPSNNKKLTKNLVGKFL